MATKDRGLHTYQERISGKQAGKIFNTVRNLEKEPVSLINITNNPEFRNFITETKQKLLAYEMDETSFYELYSDSDRKLMKKLREVLYEK